MAFGLKESAGKRDIQDAWLGRVSWWRPGLEVTGQYREDMGEVIDALELDCEPDADWLPVLVGMVEEDVGEVRDTPDIEPSQLATIAGRFHRAPRTVPHWRLALNPACAEVGAYIAPLLDLEEFRARDLTGGLGDFDILWKPRGYSARGGIANATMGVIPLERRDTWPTHPAPNFCLRINLPYWLLADAHERERLIHHELCHSDRSNGSPSTRQHDIEENLETAYRYGARDLAHARLMQAALRHPRTQAMLEADPSGQLELPMRGGGLVPRNVLTLAR